MRVMGRETTAAKRDIELLDAVYRRGLRRFLARLAGIGESHWRGQAGEGFHQALAHLAVAQENGLQLIRASLAGRVTLPPSRNGAASEADLTDRPPTGLLALIEQLVEEQLAIMIHLPDDGLLETPAIVPEWSRPGNLGRLYDHLYVHLVFHYEELRTQVGDPPLLHWFEEWMPEASNDFYDRLFRLFPLIYRPRPPGEGETAEHAPETICVDLMQPGGGRWTLLLDQQAARVELGCEGPATSTIKGKPREFFDFLRGEGKRVKVSGGRQAGRNLGTLFPLA